MQTLPDEGFAARQRSYQILLDKVKGGATLTASELSAMARFEKEVAKSGLDLPVYLETVDEVVKYSGYKTRSIYTAVKDGELARLGDGRFSREAVDLWLEKKGKRPVVFVDKGDDEDGEGEVAGDGKLYKASAEEGKYRHFKARREEIIVQRLEGELLPREEVERMFLDRVHEFRTALLLFSRRVAHQIAAEAGIDSRRVEEILDKEARELLKSLSRKVVIHVA